MHANSLLLLYEKLSETGKCFEYFTSDENTTFSMQNFYFATENLCTKLSFAKILI